MFKTGCAVAGLLVGAWPVTASAQDQTGTSDKPTPVAASAAPDTESDEIIVTGELPGAVDGDIPPQIQLSPADVRAYGVASISDLITELAPQTGSGRGRGGEMPVILLNGRRISSFAEIRDMPAEAILRVDILPEEVALKYGYSANQKVVNIVLRPRFRALTTEFNGSMPTAGGYSTNKTNFDLLKINRDGRINVDVKYNGGSRLLESERNISPVTTSLFDTRGNITGVIDPATGLAGPIDPSIAATIVGVPASAAGGPQPLSAFAAGAGSRNVTDLSSYRTLIAPTKEFVLNGTYTRNFTKLTAAFNASVDAKQSRSLLGLPSETLTLPSGNPYSPFADDVTLSRYVDDIGTLSRDTKSLAAHAGVTLNGNGLPWSKSWRWSVIGTFDRTDTRSITENGIDPAGLQAALDANDPTANPFGATNLGLVGILPANYAHSVSNVGSVDVMLNGSLFKMPAGDVATSVKVSGETSDFNSDSDTLIDRVLTPRAGQVSRDTGMFRGNLDLPIASRRRGVLSGLGELSVNGNVEVDQLSDFGTLVTTGYGLNWSPFTKLRIIASVTDEESAPTANQLGDPTLVTPNVRVYDYVRGQTVTISTITGGNPLLTSDSRHVLNLGLNLSPISDKDLTVSANYVSSTTRNQIAAFPAATAAIEAAFPDRFNRDASGQLISIDDRAVNFASATRKQLRWGINFSTPLSSSLEKKLRAMRAAREAARAEAEKNGTPLPPETRPFGQGQGQQRPSGGFFGGGPGGPGGGGPRPGGGRGFGGPNGALAGRIQFSLYHTWYFKDQVKVRDGLPVIDLLHGGATGDSGGQSAHEIEAQAGVSKDGFGARVIGKWDSATTVFTGLTDTDELHFGSLATVNLRFFVDMGQQLNLVRNHRWLRGARITLSVNNLFDARQRVTDQTGKVPLSYQPDLLDPTGRSVALSFRKLFF